MPKFLFILLFISFPSFAELKPLLALKSDLIFEDNFDSGTHSKQWNFIHGTRFTVKDGVLTGVPSPKEYQEAKKKAGKGHTGGTPSSHLMVGTKDCIIAMSFKISGKMKGLHIGYNDGSMKSGTGHVCRVTYSITDGISLIKDKNSKKEGDKAEALANKPFTLELDKWYVILIENIGDEMVAQIEGGPVIYAAHQRLTANKTHINLPTRGGGTVYYDNVKIWKANVNPQWQKNKEDLQK
jgi:hypothetical protein